MDGFTIILNMLFGLPSGLIFSRGKDYGTKSVVRQSLCRGDRKRHYFPQDCGNSSLQKNKDADRGGKEGEEGE